MAEEDESLVPLLVQASADLGQAVAAQCRAVSRPSPRVHAWRVVASPSDAHIYVSASFASRRVRALSHGQVVYGSSFGPETDGQLWVRLNDASGFVSASTIAMDFPGLGWIPARRILEQVVFEDG